MSDANQVFYAYAPETTFATPPDATPFQKIRYTGGNGWPIADTLTDSGEVRSDLMRSRPAITQRAADGGIDFEFSDSVQYRDWIAMAITATGASLSAAWSTSAATAAAATSSAPAGPSVSAAAQGSRSDAGSGARRWWPLLHLPGAGVP